MLPELAHNRILLPISVKTSLGASTFFTSKVNRDTVVLNPFSTYPLPRLECDRSLFPPECLLGNSTFLPQTWPVTSATNHLLLSRLDLSRARTAQLRVVVNASSSVVTQATRKEEAPIESQMNVTSSSLEEKICGMRTTLLRTPLGKPHNLSRRDGGDTLYYTMWGEVSGCCC